MITAYPRKGTITQDEQSNQEHFDCSLSPQGDDNRRRLQWVHTSRTDCSLSPQGDDNIIIVIYMQSPCIAAYPRKGAKNSASKDAEFFFYKP